MLVITRRVGESLFIGNDIEVVVLAVKGNQIRIGIQAPKEIEVLREELCDIEETKV
jgi:carbon storage regulator